MCTLFKLPLFFFFSFPLGSSLPFSCFLPFFSFFLLGSTIALFFPGYCLFSFLFSILFVSFDFLGPSVPLSFFHFFPGNSIASSLFGILFLFFNKFGWLLFFLCDYLSLFCFNWASFFNKSIWVNLFKLIFFHPSTFPLSTKQKWEKIKYFLSSYFTTPPTKWTLR